MVNKNFHLSTSAKNVLHPFPEISILLCLSWVNSTGNLRIISNFRYSKTLWNFEPSCVKSFCSQVGCLTTCIQKLVPLTLGNGEQLPYPCPVTKIEQLSTVMPPCPWWFHFPRLQLCTANCIQKISEYILLTYFEIRDHIHVAFIAVIVFIIVCYGSSLTEPNV